MRNNTTMSREERATAYSMRRLGKTYSYIAKILGYKYQCVARSVLQLYKKYGNLENPKPALKKDAIKMRESGMTYSAIAKELGKNETVIFNWTCDIERPKTIKHLARIHKINYFTVKARLRNGMPLDLALTKSTPKMRAAQ
jgi:hypothetical protein